MGHLIFKKKLVLNNPNRAKSQTKALHKTLHILTHPKTQFIDQKNHQTLSRKRKRKLKLQTLILLSLSLLIGISAEQCGRQAGGAVCPAPSSGGGISSLVSSYVFDQMLKYRNDVRCSSVGLYKYDAFIAAARSFNGFGTTGDVATRKKEFAPSLAQTSHVTSGGWESAPDGPYAWGYCFVNDRNQDVYCTPSSQYPCAAGKQYYGRGSMLLTLKKGNYNYGQAGKAIGKDLLNNPDLVATDPVVSFKTAIWFWMTPQGNKPSSHDAITGRWSPSSADKSAGRVPGYGVITNILNGALECGNGQNAMVASRIGFYKRYCEILGVSPGDNLDCYNQSPFA